MSANADVLTRAGIAAPGAPERSLPEIANTREASAWNPEEFAREQIRNLVQRVFFDSQSPLIKQVVFTAMRPETDVAILCGQVGRALSTESHSDIAVVESDPHAAPRAAHPRQRGSLKSWSVQIAANLWRVPGFGGGEGHEQSGEYWLSCLTQLRNEFEYAIIHGPAADRASEVCMLGKLSDGIVLVLDANSTRKVIARRLKKTLEATQVRILGSVLSGRRFPMPYGIYRRL